jgi:anti-anti-sigma regulatory factor
MSLLILSHPWEVHEVADGTSVKITRRDLDVETISILADELFELALEDSNPPKLYVDFAEVHSLPSIVFGKLFALDRRLREAGGSLVVRNLKPPQQKPSEAETRPDD